MTATVEQHESCVSRATSSVEGASPAPATLDARRSWQSQRTLRPFGRLPTPGPRLRGRDPGLLWQKPGRDNRRKKKCHQLPILTWTRDLRPWCGVQDFGQEFRGVCVPKKRCSVPLHAQLLPDLLQAPAQSLAFGLRSLRKPFP